MKHFLFVTSILSLTTISYDELLLKMQWKYLDLLWNSPQKKEETIASGRYNASAAFLYDVDIRWRHQFIDGRIFITAIRDKGVPVSLFTVTEEQGKGGPLLRPYPDWSWYKDDCKGITGGVYQIEIRCNHLFVVDDGRIGEDQRCLPQLLIFDLSTDKLIKRVTVPINIAHNENAWGSLASFFMIILADTLIFPNRYSCTSLRTVHSRLISASATNHRSGHTLTVCSTDGTVSDTLVLSAAI
ncbi:major royal jelly protein 3-like [Pogonomyrmex barbatus]|uniref:Major royal jelly protein 3-like n=1 Tax=Pogonomyrmex barbatus TaxID=144034 RepID=A0A6I9WE76_9HYME|nr:major royal jelly protein 3-like [Pogonomyrmex barbatus]